MQIEPLETREKIKPNVHLNNYVTYHALDFFAQSDMMEELSGSGMIQLLPGATNIEIGTIEHMCGLGLLERAGEHTYIQSGHIPAKEEYQDSVNLVEQTAQLLNDSIAQGESTRAFQRRASKIIPIPMAASAGQCLMLTSYRDLCENLFPVHMGEPRPQRSQPENARGSGAMMELASRAISKRLATFIEETYTGNEVVLELGAGSAQFSLDMLLASEEALAPVQIFATDIADETFDTAEKTFSHADRHSDFHWMRIDMGDTNHMGELADILDGKRVIIHIGYILHEYRDLALNALKNIHDLFPNAVLVASEYFLQDEITEDVPLWFQTIHRWSDQDLFYFDELIETASQFGFEPFERVDHNLSGDPDRPRNASIFFSQGVL